MSHKKLVYNGISSEDLNLVIQETPVYTFPSRDITKTHVPGRNGDIITDNGCYQNTTRVYNIAKGWVDGTNASDHLAPNAMAISQWLMSANGSYVRLEDDYDPNVYRLATYVDGGTYTDYFDKALAFTATFDCKPQRFLKSGETNIEYTTGITDINIENIYNYTSNPLITISGFPSGLTSQYLLMLSTTNSNIANSILTLSNINQGETLYIDSDNLNIYDSNNNDKTENVNLNGKNFPILKKGNNNINLSLKQKNLGTVTSYKTTLNNNQIKCVSEYVTKDTVIEEKSEKIYIDAWKDVISKYSIDYSGISYKEYCKQNCPNYTTSDVNSLFNSGCKCIYISGIMSNNNLTGFSEISLELLSGQSATGKYKVKTAVPGFFRTSKEDKIYFRPSSKDIVSEIDPEDSVGITIYFYKATSVGNYYSLSLVDEINSNLPSWLHCTVGIYNSNNQNDPSTTSQDGSYINKFYWIANSTGIYWKAGENILNKESWNYFYINQNTSLDSKILNYYEWESSNLKWKVTGLFSLSSLLSGSTYTFTYRYYNTLEPLQYKQENDEIPIKFEVVLPQNIPLTNSLDTVQLKAINTEINKYYLLVGYNNDNWKKVISNDMNIGSAGYISSTDFVIRYLSSVPNYEDYNLLQDKEWPSYLDSRPYNSLGVSTGIDILNAANIRFKLTNNYDTSTNSIYIRIGTSDSDSINYSIWLNQFRGSGDNAYLHYKQTSESSSEIKEFNSTNGRAWIYGMVDDPNNISVINNRRFKINEIETSITNIPYIKYIITLDIKYYSNPNTIITVYRDKDHHEDTGDLHSYYDTNGNFVCYLYNKDSYIASENDKIYNNTSSADNAPKGYAVSETKIIYYSLIPQGSSSYFYRWNSNENFKQIFQSNVELFSTSGKDDSTIITLSSLPSVQTSGLTNFLDVTNIIQDSIGNPIKINYKVPTNVSGYYKVGSQANWEYYTSGQIIYTAFTNESDITVQYLTNAIGENVPSLGTIQIKIKPNWWML